MRGGGRAWWRRRGGWGRRADRAPTPGGSPVRVVSRATPPLSVGLVWSPRRPVVDAGWGLGPSSPWRLALRCGPHAPAASLPPESWRRLLLSGRPSMWVRGAVSSSEGVDAGRQQTSGGSRSSWRISSFSSQEACVEVLVDTDLVRVRNSRNRTLSAVTFGAGVWSAFTAGIRGDEFDHFREDPAGSA